MKVKKPSILRMLHNNQRGFTLIELMIAIAITGLITGGITGAIFQVLTGNARTSNHMTTVRQVQNAGYWVSHDGQMAQSVVITGVSGFPLTLTCAKWDDSAHTVVTYTVTYELVGDELWRNYDGQQMRVAQYIVPGTPKTKCELTAGGTFTLPDKDDAFTITGGAVADNGKITVATGNISVKAAGGATYKEGTGVWTTPAAAGTVVVKAKEASTAGMWTSTTTSARVAITADVGTNGNATITGCALVFTVTATVGEQSETRIYEVIPRPDS